MNEGTQESCRYENLTRAEAADFLRIGRKKLDDWAWQGKGPRYAIVGRQALYRRKDLEEWLEAQMSDFTPQFNKKPRGSLL